MKKIALIGAGAFTDFSLSGYQKYLPNVKFAAVFDKESVVAKTLAEKYNITKVATSLDELLATDVDAVLVLTRPDTHYQLGKRVVESLRSALIEKPLAFTVAEAQELVAIAEKNKQHITANLVLRFHPFHQEIRELASNCRYGKLVSISSEARLAEYPAEHWYWRPEISGGFFLNTYVHFIDLFRFVVNERAEEAYHRGRDDKAQEVTVRFPSVSTSLTVDLHAKNDEEQVVTNYYFENATVTTHGWLPQTMLIQVEGHESKTVTDELPKEERYQRILSAIAKELIEPHGERVINHEDLVEAVRVPLLAQANMLGRG